MLICLVESCTVPTGLAELCAMLIGLTQSSAVLMCLCLVESSAVLIGLAQSCVVLLSLA